jgi:hypothetical protein
MPFRAFHSSSHHGRPRARSTVRLERNFGKQVFPASERIFEDCVRIGFEDFL